ncbi:MAG: HAMP domain-containing histidine kinase [Clostridia bacterium]|nr:HAMP domain-containing histidine kinase [Clostridia bacterium]
MNTEGIRRLRKKFIGISMLSLLLVLIFIFLSINLTVFFSNRSSIRKRLNGLSEQREQEQRYDFNNPSMGDIFVPELRNNLFYVFTFDKDGNYTVRTNAPDNVAEDDIIGFAESIYGGKKDFGREGNYYYQKSSDADEKTVVALLNCESELSMVFRIIILSVIIFFFVMAVMFVLVYRLSAYAIKPEIENNRKQREFITNASHELKTPLAVIRANTELMEVTSGENEWTKSTLAQVDRVDGLIKNLVMIAKSEEKESRNEKISSFDISLAVEQTTDTYSAVAKQTEKILEKKIESGLAYVADEGKIRQLATILLDNAMKYCDDKGKIVVELFAGKKGAVVLAVSNDYKDGDSVDYSHFFERFYRQDASHNIDKGGYGIGLSIAESICEECQGTIKANWVDGVITFTCTLC